MREIERKTQWCPHRRHPFLIAQPGADIAVAANAAGPVALPDLLGFCVGSICSQWRWDSEAIDRVPGPQPVVGATWNLIDGHMTRAEPTRPAGLPASYLWVPVRDAWERPWGSGLRHGHCGLSGAPGPD
jgi:hypothetical protein